MASLLSMQETVECIEDYEKLNRDRDEDSDLDDLDGSQDFTNDTDENQEDEIQYYADEENDDKHSESEGQPKVPSMRPASRMTRGQSRFLEAEESENESDFNSPPKPSKPSRNSREPTNTSSEYKPYVGGSGPALAPIGILPENGLGGEIIISVMHNSELLAPAVRYYYVVVPGEPDRPKKVMPRDIRNYVSAATHESWDFVAFSTWAKAQEGRHGKEEKATQAKLDALHGKYSAESWERSIMQTQEEGSQPLEEPEAIAAKPAMKRPGLSKVGNRGKKRPVPYNVEPWNSPEDYESSHWSGSSDGDDIPAVAIPKKRQAKAAAKTPPRPNSASLPADAEPFVINPQGNDSNLPKPHLKKLLIQRGETATSKPSRRTPPSLTFMKYQQSKADVSALASQRPISPFSLNIFGSGSRMEDGSGLFPDEELETIEVTASNAAICKSDAQDLKAEPLKTDDTTPNRKGFNGKESSTHWSNLVQSREASANTIQSFHDESEDISYNPGTINNSFSSPSAEYMGSTNNSPRGSVDLFDQELSHLGGQDTSNSRQVKTKLDSTHVQQQVKEKLSMTEVNTLSSNQFPGPSRSSANSGYHRRPSSQARRSLSGNPELFDQQLVLHHQPGTKSADILAAPAPAPAMVSEIGNSSRYIENKSRASGTIASLEDQGTTLSSDQSQMDSQASAALNLNSKRSLGSTLDTGHNKKSSSSTWPKRPRERHHDESLYLILMKEHDQSGGKSIDLAKIPNYRLSIYRACTASDRISKIIARKRDALDSWDAEDLIMREPTHSRTHVRNLNRRECRDALFFWGPHLEKSLDKTTDWKLDIARRISLLSKDEQWRAVVVWAKWANGTPDRVLGLSAADIDNALLIGEFLDANEVFMERMRSARLLTR